MRTIQALMLIIGALVGCTPTDTELETIAKEICLRSKTCLDPIYPKESCIDDYIELSQDDPDCFNAIWDCIYKECHQIRDCIKTDNRCDH
jgi:hypothetical protein